MKHSVHRNPGVRFAPLLRDATARR